MLENKLGIINQLELNRIEERVSKEKAKQLYDSGDIDRVEAVSYTHLNIISMVIAVCSSYNLL